MLVCKYCRKNKLVEYFECINCKECIHTYCLKGCKIPGGLLGDVFFIFTCQDCNGSGSDYLERDKMAWVDVLLLTLYNLAKKFSDQATNGYFHCNKHIKKFVNLHWNTLFPHIKTKRKSWKQMITSTLKSFSPEYFLCGDGLCGFPSGLTGWYRLARADILPNQALLDRKGKKKKRKLDPETSKFNYFSEESVWCESSGQETDHSAPSISAFNIFCSDSSSAHENMYSRSYVKPTASLSENLFAEDDKIDEIDVEATDLDPPPIEIKFERDSPSSSFSLPKTGILSFEENKNEDDLLVVDKIKKEPLFEEDINIMNIKQEPKFEEDSMMDQEWKSDSEDDTASPTVSSSLFFKNENSNYKPWLSSSFKSSNMTSINRNEELYLLSNLSKKIFDGSMVSIADIRLHRKLRVRRLRREKNIPVFDLNSFCNNSWNLSKSTKDFRVLDRYQHQTVISNVEEKLGSFRTRLLGHTDTQYSCFVSPFTQRALKPFIRRDYESNPLWLKLLGELQAKVNKKNSNWIPPPRSPIDYCYVRPQHIPAINSLAQQYFWPGINLSECLQYPDFSCVVLYKKLIVAFAFLVPDVSINEAYISFIFTRPEWRRAGIGTFMLYHLIQTCMGRDITLHVSATNSALLLYQKFGFKVEEFVQDFYDRYLPIDSNECKHALFLRLSR